MDRGASIPGFVVGLEAGLDVVVAEVGELRLRHVEELGLRVVEGDEVLGVGGQNAVPRREVFLLLGGVGGGWGGWGRRVVDQDHLGLVGVVFGAGTRRVEARVALDPLLHCDEQLEGELADKAVRVANPLLERLGEGIGRHHLDPGGRGEGELADHGDVGVGGRGQGGLGGREGGLARHGDAGLVVSGLWWWSVVVVWGDGMWWLVCWVDV